MKAKAVSRFYEPTPEMLTKLNAPWCASYSGGKDSSSLVTWVEWLRRSGQITVRNPQLVQSNTGVEDAKLNSLSLEMMETLRACGWQCVVVEPKIHEKLYNRIFGIGNTPIHPGGRAMRWCTRSTKIDPMERWRKVNSSGLTLTGLRLGESAIRDGKILKAKGCQSGGECGIPVPSERTYSPLLNWTTCNVGAWLSGDYDLSQEVRRVMAHIFELTKRLVEIYEMRVGQKGFETVEAHEWVERTVEMARFGCIGCPAISCGPEAPKSMIARYGADSPLCELYAVWNEALSVRNRLQKEEPGKRNTGMGPLKMEARQRLFARVLDIQRRAEIVLVNPEDEAFIRQCWKEQRYPRGWSAANELTSPEVEERRDRPLFQVTINGV